MPATDADETVREAGEPPWPSWLRWLFAASRRTCHDPPKLPWASGVGIGGVGGGTMEPRYAAEAGRSNNKRRRLGTFGANHTFKQV